MQSVSTELLIVRRRELIFAFNFPFRNTSSIWSPARRILGRESVHMIQNWTSVSTLISKAFQRSKTVETYFHLGEQPYFAVFFYYLQ